MQIAVEIGRSSRPASNSAFDVRLRRPRFAQRPPPFVHLAPLDCGEHGGDPDSVKFCHKLGLNYVRCSPFRVPVARLAVRKIAKAAPVPGAAFCLRIGY